MPHIDEATIARRLASTITDKNRVLLSWFRFPEPSVRYSGDIVPEEFGDRIMDVMLVDDEFDGKREGIPLLYPGVEFERYDLMQRDLSLLIHRALNIVRPDDAIDFVREFGILHNREFRVATRRNENAPDYLCSHCSVRGYMETGINLRAILDLYLSVQDRNSGKYLIRRNGRIFFEHSLDGTCNTPGMFIGICEDTPNAPPDEDLARMTMCSILKDAMKKASFETEYLALPGQVAIVQKPKDLYSLIWKTVSDTITMSPGYAKHYLHKCAYCPQWSIEDDMCKGNEGWYHDPCKRRHKKRLKDEKKATAGGIERKERPGARKEGYFG